MSKKQKKIEIEKYLPGLFARTEGYASNVSKYYTAAVNALLDLAADVDLEPDTVFYFADHKKLSVKATNVLRGLYSAVYQEIRRGVIAEWEFANLSNDAMIESIFGKGLQEDNHYARWFSRNRDAMDAFFKRKSEYGGLNLSQKVWKYTSQFKEEMELALSASLGRGDSAATVSRRVRQYLQEPDKLFRRVRDEEGNLQLSKRAAAYHPGRGEYRSSYRNAMRLARTETNMAYRAADCERWSDIPFVVGMEVRRSNHPFACSVCEALAGKYPKDFKFVGWHPQCRCYIVPVLADEKERMAYHKAMLNGEDVEGWKFDGEITEPHSGFKKWMNDNADRVERARERGTLPYWVKDNEKYVGAAAKPQPTGKGVFRATDAAGTVDSHSVKNTLSKETPTDSSRAAIKTAQKELVEWYKQNLPETTVGKFTAKRFEIKDIDGMDVIINRKFYDEIISKYQDDPLYKLKLEYAQKAHEIFPTAGLTNPSEQEKDHPGSVFRVYESVIDDNVLEWKVKCNRDANILYYLRVYKR